MSHLCVNTLPYIYDVSISGFTRSSMYIYDISSLRVNRLGNFSIHRDTLKMMFTDRNT